MPQPMPAATRDGPSISWASQMPERTPTTSAVTTTRIRWNCGNGPNTTTPDVEWDSILTLVSQKSRGLACERGVQPDLLDQRGAGAVQVQLPVGAVRRPSRLGEEPAQVVVPGHRPQHGALEAVVDQGVRGSLHHARAVALAALGRVDRDLGELAVDDRVAVGVARG